MIRGTRKAHAAQQLGSHRIGLRSGFSGSADQPWSQRYLGVMEHSRGRHPPVVPLHFSIAVSNVLTSYGSTVQLGCLLRGSWYLVIPSTPCGTFPLSWILCFVDAIPLQDGEISHQLICGRPAQISSALVLVWKSEDLLSVSHRPRFLDEMLYFQFPMVSLGSGFQGSQLSFYLELPFDGYRIQEVGTQVLRCTASLQQRVQAVDMSDDLDVFAAAHGYLTAHHFTRDALRPVMHQTVQKRGIEDCFCYATVTL